MRRRWIVLVEIAVVLLAVGCGSTSCGTLDWSPDGRRLVTVWPTGKDLTVLRVTDTDTGKSRTIPGSAKSFLPSWSPDGSMIAFTKETDRNSTGVFVHDLASGQTRLVCADACGPCVWREDSARLLAFGPSSTALCLTMPDGAPTWEAHVPGTPALDNPAGAWIPNTDNVALLIDKDLWLVEAAEAVRLTTTSDVLGFVVGPGGKELIWARSSRNPRYVLMSLYALPLKERGSRQLRFPFRVAGINPSPRSAPVSVDSVAFSPDGTRLALTCTFGAGKGPEQTRWYSVATDGSDARLAWTLEHKAEATGSSGWALDRPVYPPAFSRDSRRLALMVEGERSLSLIVCRADGTGCRRVVTSSTP